MPPPRRGRSTKRRRVRPEDMGKRVKPVDGPVTDKAKVLVYADNKVGKTTFAASAPNCLIIDINEQGTRSVRGRDTGAHKLEVTDWFELDAAYWWLKAHRKEFESVAIDTLTGMSELAQRLSLDEAETRDPERLRTLDQRTWGKVKSLMAPQILAFRNLPLHVVFTAQVKKETDEDTGELVGIVPDIAGGARGVALGAVGVTGYLSKVRPKRRADRAKKWPRVMLVGDHEIIKAGNRVGLPRMLKDPTMSDIIEAYRA